MKTKKYNHGISSDTRGITLLGLILVITIFLVVTVIAFMLFQSFMSQTRDALRTTALKNIETGVDLYLAKTGQVPEPDDVMGATSFNGKEINMVGIVGNNVAKKLQMVEAPLDPKAHVAFWYGTDISKRYYQLALTYEREVGFNPCMNVTYADSPYQANVSGTYNYPLKVDNTLYSIPSLLSMGSGILTDDTPFIVDRGANIPYSFGGDYVGTQNVPEVLNIITGESGLSLTGVNIPNLSKTEYASAQGIPISFSGVALSLGLNDKNKLGGAIYGEYSKNTDSGKSDLCNVTNHNNM